MSINDQSKMEKSTRAKRRKNTDLSSAVDPLVTKQIVPRLKRRKTIAPTLSSSPSRFMPEFIGQDNHINIGKTAWHALCAKLNRRELVELLNRIVDINDLEPPYRMTSTEQAWSDFQALKSLDTINLVHVNYNHARMSYKHPLSLLTVDVNNIGTRVSDPYFQKIRFTCKGSRVISPKESWSDPIARKAIFNHIIDQNVEFVDRHVIRKALGTRRYIAAQYRPALAKALIDYIQPTSILDLSFGWGDRLIGFEAAKSAKHYIGIDPDQRVIEAGNTLHKALKQRSKKVALYCAQAESFQYEMLDQKVDMLYFAPPPFNDERYTDESTQAYLRYTSEHAFVDHFIVKAVTAAWRVLNDGGVLAFDMGDLRGSNRNEQKRFVDRALNAFKQLPDAYFIGTVGARINDRAIKDQYGARIDPIWLITKGTPHFVDQALFGKSE
ncbi:hypothetical protein CWB96_00070 [Pseudoalteromonas citrea]|uniref:Methyltransferase domain-containing protein n=1 Tax=Pseudoalteromonas citrea TaxID=43655 RepID=A0A5S3XVB2_9GAMM|nr:class I SAM-dependent methyltransferase [Pseudoalteromonas citrea]TMP46261.1 hypothetical protein CWB97_02065 [Pseudoalteromonas citrea]TMP63037.1 hypothetical protein CWB96_00070 [Pseudoalteromonas citrea]